MSVKAILKKPYSYAKEVREEMQKITWPSREQVTRYFVVVLAVCAAVALFFVALDQLFTLGLEQLLKLS